MTTDIPRSLVITDRRLVCRQYRDETSNRTSPDGIEEWLPRCLASGVEAIQVREKDLEDAELLQLLRRVVETVRTSRWPQVKVLVNGRLDLALAAGADGVHLPSRGLPTQILRQHLLHHRLSGAPHFLIGRSTHHLHEVQQAAQDGTDFVTFGPLFATPSKVNLGDPPGPEVLRRVCEVGIAVLALGGIGPKEVPVAQGAGAHGVAAIRAFVEDPEALGAQIRAAWPAEEGRVNR